MTAWNDVRQRMAARRITRWARPLQAEPAHGFFLRIAALHRQTSAATFAQDLGIDEAIFITRARMAIEASTLGTAEDKAALAHWTASVDGDAVTLGGQTVRRGDWSIKTRRFCPGCLHEAAHHRAWFDFTFVINCPFHGVPLLDRHPDGTRNFWVNPSLQTIARGGRLAREIPRLAEPPLTLEAYALGRLGLMPPMSCGLVDDASLGEVIEAAEMMGRLSIDGYNETMPSYGPRRITKAIVQAAGFPVLAEGVPAVKALFRNVAAQSPLVLYGSFRIFGWAYKGFTNRSALTLRLRRLMRETAREIGRAARIERPGDKPVEPEFVTIAEASAKLGRTQDVLLTAVQALDVLQPHKGGTGTPYLVAAANLPAVSAMLESSLSRTEAAAFLHVDRDVFTMIVRSRLIRKIGPRWASAHEDHGPEDRYERDELNRFLDSIPVAEPTAKTAGMSSEWVPMTVPEVLTATAYDAGAFFREVLEGRLTVRCRVGSTRGLAAFVFEAHNQPRDHPFTKRCLSTNNSRGNRSVDCMSQKELCALLTISPQTAKVLVDLGYVALADDKSPHNRQKVDRASAAEFAARYAPGKIYAKALGCHRSHAGPTIARMGVVDLLTKDHPTFDTRRLSPLFDRAAVRNLLGLKGEPDHDPGRAFWKRLASYLGRHGSSFAVWRLNDGPSALLSTSNFEWPVRVTYVFDGEATTHAAPPGGLAYTIQARLRIAGVDGRAKTAELAATAGERLLHPALRVRADVAAGVFEADIDARCVLMSAEERNGMDAVNALCEADFERIELMVLMMKASFEEAQGTRRHDHRMFGPWAEPFVRDGTAGPS